ncbi:MAG: hypothetical protein HYY35_01005 [Deltaproteobacteria bacterium]|nr:hypothetical protein [Deltaproteobacteria bacterium]
MSARWGLALLSAGVALIVSLAGGCGEDDLTFPGAETPTPTASATPSTTATPTPSSGG